MNSDLRRTIVVLTLGAVAAAATARAAGAFDPAPSTVLVRMTRLHRATEVVTYGTGLLIHPEGYIIASASSSGNTVQVPAFGGGSEEVEAEPIDIMVFSRAPDGGVGSAEARIVSIHEKSDLVLLKTVTLPGVAFDLDRAPAVPEEGELRLAGFAFESPFATTLVVESNPVMNVYAARIVEVTRSRSGRVTSVSTDAVIDAGHCGGWALDGDGRPRGMVVCRAAGGGLHAEVLSFASASSFFFSKVFKASASPGVIVDPTEAVTVRLDPGLSMASLEGWSVRATAEAGGRALGEVAMVADATGWVGTVDPGLVAAAGDTRSVEVALVGTDGEGRARLKKGLRLDVMTDYDGRVMKAASPPPVTAPPTPSPPPSGVPASDLQRYASRQEVPSSTIGNRQLVAKAEGGCVPDFEPDEELYALIPRYELRESAEAYDREVAAAMALLQCIDNFNHRLSNPSSEESMGEVADQRSRAMQDLGQRLEVVRARHDRVLSFNLCVCTNGQWVVCTGGACAAPRRPELPTALAEWDPWS